MAWTAVIYILSTSGRSSRSTLMLMKWALRKAAICRVLEGFPFHDVAPVAGGIADAEEDRLVLLAGAGEGLLAPREPIHRIVLVLQEVGRFFARQAVFMWSGHEGGLSQDLPKVTSPNHCKRRVELFAFEGILLL